MHIGDSREFVEIDALERVRDGLPSTGDVRVRVKVRLVDFGGLYESVWLEEPVLREFIAALAEVAHNRTGSATLQSISPEEFVLTIAARDSQEHFVAQVLLARYQYSGPTSWRTSVCGGFELAPNALPSVLAGFQALLRGVG
jgi:hypothetical protein